MRRPMLDGIARRADDRHGVRLEHAAAATRRSPARSRFSADATPRPEGVSDSWTRRSRRSFFDRISKPESRNTSSIAVLSASVVA